MNARHIMELMAGTSVSCKTGWFDLTAAQLPPYSQPAMEKAVACARWPVGAVASGRIGMLSSGGISEGALLAHASNRKIYTNHARQGRKTADRSMWRIVTFAHVAPCGPVAGQLLCDWSATKRSYDLMVRFVH